MKTAPGHRPSQQSQPNCNETCINESEFVSPPEVPDVLDTPSGEEHQVPAKHHFKEGSLKWADIILDAAQYPQTFVALPEGLSKVEDDWPTFPQPESALHDTMDAPLQKHNLDRQNGSDRVPTDAKEVIRDN
jgi:hypothetical protein